MANKKYTELPQADAITGAEILAMVQDGGSVQGDIDLIKAYFDTLYGPVFSRCSWFAHTSGGFGSTATKIPYFNTVVTNTLNGHATITNNDSTNGLAITINTAGVYSVSFWFDPSSADQAGISVNASSVTTNITSLAAAERIQLSYGNSAGFTISVSATKYFNANDVIRPHTNGSGVGTAARCGFILEKCT